MNEINANQLLEQIRTLGRDLQPRPTDTSAPAAGFGDMLKSTIDSVNQAQQYSSELKTGFVNWAGF